MGTDRPFVIDPELTGIALAYKNDKYIADSIFPRVPVTKTLFAYNKYDKGAFLQAVNGEIGRKGEPETVELKYQRETSETIPYSIKAEVPEADVMDAMASGDDRLNPLGDNTLLATESLKLSREVRVAKLLADNSTYAGNVTTLDKNTSFANKDSSVIDVFKDITDKMAAAPNYAVVSYTNALYLQTHPDFLGIYKTVNTDNKGIVPLSFVAQTLGLDEILIGQSKVNTVKQGKIPVIKNVWGNDMVFFHKNPLAKPEYGVTFGLTAEYKQLNVQTYFNGMKGSYGIHYIKPVETIKEIVLAKDCGYLVKNAFVKG